MFFNYFYQLVDGECYFGIKGRKNGFINQIGIGLEKKDSALGINKTLQSQRMVIFMEGFLLIVQIVLEQQL